MKLCEIKALPSVAAKKAKEFIDAMYKKYPRNPMNNRQFCMVWGTGEDQELAIFELEQSALRDGAVEVKWYQAYPQRQGVGSKGLKALQAEAKREQIPLTLFPWDKGRVSQTKLVKFYKSVGFNPTKKGSKNMIWEPKDE